MRTVASPAAATFTVALVALWCAYGVPGALANLPPCPASVSPSLCSQRYEAAQAFLARSFSIENMNTAYFQYAVPTITRTVQDVGDFTGLTIALEYDGLVVALTPILGYSPVLIRPTWDPSTIQWVSDDVLRLDYFLNASTLYTVSGNPPTGSYAINVEGLRTIDYYTFAPNDYHIAYDFTIQDPIASLIFGFSSQSVDAQTTCGLLFQACNRDDDASGCNAPGIPGGNCLSLTQFTSFADCVTKMSALEQGPPTPCPYRLRSNTKDCRVIHALSSFLIPTLHCAHVPIPVSPVCADKCLNGPCANAAPNSRCVAQWPGLPLDYTLNYVPVCNDGFTGDDTTSCVANTCTKDSDCPSSVATCSNTTRICQCPPTYVWDPSPRARQTRRACVCPEGTNEFTVRGSNRKVCIRNGQCQEVGQCPQARLGQRNAVQCRPYGANPYAQFNQCLCNHGYTGGVEYPCACDAPRREVHAPAAGGTVCLAPTECVRNSDCSGGARCVFANGGAIGTCA